MPPRSLALLPCDIARTPRGLRGLKARTEHGAFPEARPRCDRRTREPARSRTLWGCAPPCSSSAPPGQREDRLVSGLVT